MSQLRRHIRTRTTWAGLSALAVAALYATSALAQEISSTPVSAKIDTGDTAWLLASSALVLAMVVPGLALFYGGLVRAKNVLGTIMHSLIILCLVSLTWIFWGYSLAFGPDKGGLIGGLEWIGLRGVGAEPHATYGPTIPHLAFMTFQLMFAAITPALITGAFAERIRFSALLLFSLLWSTLIYCPLAHWIWGGGWLGKLGALDFAGGAVVHVSSGLSALACALVLGPRHGFGVEYLAPHNLPLTLLGTGLLWFGWFGFNAGSALGANAVAVSAFVATNTAAATAALVWMLVEWRHQGKPTVLGAASGVVAGLAAVTPGAGYISPLSAVLTGLLAGLACYVAVLTKGRLGYDDSLDVFGIHGIGGCIGLLATGLFASKAVNAAGADGLLFGNPPLLGIQALTVGTAALFAFAGTYLILKLVDLLLGLRVSLEEEIQGLDISAHGNVAYPSFAGAMATYSETRGAVSPAAAMASKRAVLSQASAVQAVRTSSSRAPIGSSRRPPVKEEFSRQLQPKETPLMVQEKPFALLIRTSEKISVKEIWQRLCADYPSKTPEEFNEIYPYVVTFNQDTVTFNVGDPYRFREKLERALIRYGIEGAHVELEEVED